MEEINRIIIAEDNIKADLTKNICPKCGRLYFMKTLEDGSVIEPCPVCMGLFDDEKLENKQRNKKEIF